MLEDYGYYSGFTQAELDAVQNLLMTFGIVVLVLSILAIVGSIFALMRKSFVISLIFGGICGLLSGGIFGLVGLILIALSHKDFVKTAGAGPAKPVA